MSAEESEYINLVQPSLFDFTETSSGAVELFPAVWSALEDLTSPDTAARFSGLQRLQLINAHRLSPLAAYVLATRLIDPDPAFRVEILKTLGSTLTPDSQGSSATEGVIRHLVAFLSQIRQNTILAILEAVELAPEVEGSAARLINYCPYAGAYLSDLLVDRKTEFVLRKQAVRFIGLVGFLDAVPVLEKLEARLASRLAGQQVMSFVSPAASEDTELLPEVQKTLSQLKFA